MVALAPPLISLRSSPAVVVLLSHDTRAGASSPGRELSPLARFRPNRHRGCLGLWSRVFLSRVRLDRCLGNAVVVLPRGIVVYPAIEVVPHAAAHLKCPSQVNILRDSSSVRQNYSVDERGQELLMEEKVKLSLMLVRCLIEDFNWRLLSFSQILGRVNYGEPIHYFYY